MSRTENIDFRFYFVLLFTILCHCFCCILHVQITVKTLISWPFSDLPVQCTNVWRSCPHHSAQIFFIFFLVIYLALVKFHWYWSASLSAPSDSKFISPEVTVVQNKVEFKLIYPIVFLPAEKCAAGITCSSQLNVGQTLMEARLHPQRHWTEVMQWGCKDRNLPCRDRKVTKTNPHTLISSMWLRGAPCACDLSDFLVSKKRVCILTFETQPVWSDTQYIYMNSNKLILIWSH